ncbi:recombinase family protein [Rhizobium sp. LC145]|uniref:recombinase family protein n=1 Tax=Rhizobium sp. LC145 TaxID=1120688 RepID=UPI000629F606|nr:recombinase family protein [Rhizobium sp. LC145]KKX24292.1 invertase [Rhizobium sp. LC145]TKT46197.1 recombinase family protein [Rhizobiaceae bacterium LC148]
MALIGYVRVSTDDQDTTLQRDALTRAGCDKIFSDVASGAKADRPGLTEAMRFLRDGDTFVVWKLDRAGRSLKHLVDLVVELEKKKVGFKSLTEEIDTTTPNGRLFFHLFGAFAQFERDLISERTRAGLMAASAKGRKGGRKPVVDAEKLKRAKELIKSGLNVKEAAGRLKVGKSALYDALKAERGGAPLLPAVLGNTRSQSEPIRA